MANKLFSYADCSPIKKEKEDSKDQDYFLEYAQLFAKTDKIFRLSKSKEHSLNISENPFAYYKDGNVWTGRWIGQVQFTPRGEKQPVNIEIKPRFGESSVFAMIEEAFSCNIVDNRGESKSSKKTTSLIERLIPFMWMHKLSAANLYGVPHANISVYHKGISIKGRLDVRKSIFPLFREGLVVSVKREKQIDEPISQIILQAYKKLNKNKMLQNRLTDNAENALNALESANYPLRHITENEYRKIHYKPIYVQYKDVVDFSWQILNSHVAESEGNKKSLSGFLDMAEIWEIYLRSIFRKNFAELGWTVESPEINVYEETFWSRNIVPDIVMTKGNDVVVFDAKWKKMAGTHEDVAHSDLDRSDFFQIHSYISYYKSLGKRVVLAGLLYPLEDDGQKVNKDFLEQIKEKGMVDSNLWGEDDSTKFVVSGILLKKQPEGIDENGDGEEYKKYKKDIENAEKAFVEAFIARIKELLHEK